jgi:parvulin-like peptidyl-prolyl isomerase
LSHKYLCSFLIAGLLAGSALCASGQDHAYLGNWYDPTGDVVLATFQGGQVTDLDLYLYLQMIGVKQPAIFKQYQVTLDQDGSTTATARLRDLTIRYVNDYIHDFHLAQEELLPAENGELSALRQRYYLVEAAKWIWLTEAIKPRIRIAHADRVNYYNKNQARFMQPETAQGRLLLRRPPENATLANLVALQRELRAIAQQVDEGLDFAEAARQFSEAPNAAEGGLLPPMNKGESDSLIAQVLFSLPEGGVSEVVEGPDGFFLLQCVSRQPVRPRPFDDVTEEIEQALRENDLRQLFQLEKNKLLKQNRSFADYGRLPQRDAKQVVIKVDKQTLTVGELIEAFPEIYPRPVWQDAGKLSQVAKRLREGELIARDAERRGLFGDPRIRRARTIAQLLSRSEVARQTLWASCPSPAEAEVRAYHQDNPDLDEELAAAPFEHVKGRVRTALLQSYMKQTEQEDFEKIAAEAQIVYSPLLSSGFDSH